MNKNNRAFTLIELLVVVSIVAILVGILMPSLIHARFQAKVVACQVNLKALGTATQLYAEENREKIPRGPVLPAAQFAPYYSEPAAPTVGTNRIWIGRAGTPSYDGWGIILEKYLTNKKAFFCPDDNSISWEGELGQVGKTGGDAHCSYMFRQLDCATNDLLGNLGDNDLGRPARALAMDANVYLVPAFAQNTRFNHKSHPVNLLFNDLRVESLGDSRGNLSMTGVNPMDQPGYQGKLDTLFQNADGEY